MSTSHPPGLASALALTASWPVRHVSAGVLRRTDPPDVLAASVGDTSRRYRLASLSKPIVAWCALVAVEEGTIALDQPAGPPGATVRHLLAHASGLPFDAGPPLAPVGARRIYSNADIEAVAALIADASGMPFDTYLHDAVLDPLGMTATELRGSPAYAIWSTVDDVARFLHEAMAPRLLAPETAAEATTVQFPHLAGVLPGVGPMDPNPWGLGWEIRAAKSPHWTGRTNSADTFGHFGGAGTFMWVDPRRDIALVALTDRAFDEWSSDALRLWPELSDAVLAAVDTAGGAS